MGRHWSNDVPNPGNEAPNIYLYGEVWISGM